MSPAGELRTAAEALAAIAWLERHYDRPGAFENPTTYGPDGFFSVLPDHIEECSCDVSGSDFWAELDGAMKWGKS